VKVHSHKTLSPVSGRIVLSGTGQSFSRAHGDRIGNTFLAMSGGQISAMLVELAGLDVAESLGYLRAATSRSGSLWVDRSRGKWTDGRADSGIRHSRYDHLAKVTSTSDEKVNLVVLPVPKDFSPLSLARTSARGTNQEHLGLSGSIQLAPIRCLKDPQCRDDACSESVSTQGPGAGDVDARH
jgi:hypothetical protein